MLYPVTSRRVRTNAYFIPAFAGLGTKAGGTLPLITTLPITSKIAQQDEMFRRDQRRVKELQDRIKLLNQVTVTRRGLSTKVNIPPALAREFPSKPAPVRRSRFRRTGFRRTGAKWGTKVQSTKARLLAEAQAQLKAAQDDLQHAANSALQRLLIQLPYKAHIIVGRYVPSKDAVVYDVTKDGEMIQEGVSSVAGAKTVVDKEIAAQQEAVLAQSAQDRAAAQHAAEQQGPPTATVEDVAMDLTSQEQGQTQQGPGTTAPSNGEKKKNNLPLILGAGAAGIAALVLMK